MKEIPVIGMSPGNSYFKDEVVKELLKKVVEQYGKTAVLIADIPAISTYVALGYPENRARRDKAIPQGNNLRNRVGRAMEELGYSTEQVKIVDWEAGVENNVDYRKKFEEVSKLYEDNPAFQKAANETTKQVLDSENGETVDSSIKIAVKYLLSELAFMEFAPKLLGTEKAVYIYHKNWSVYESYIAGEFDGKQRNHLGFNIVSIINQSSKPI